MNYSRQFLGKPVTVIIDRPMGSSHPKHGFLYPVNYGYIEGVIAPDGEELDAYVLGIDTLVEKFDGTCIAIVHRTNDDDDKLIVVPNGMDISDEEIRRLTEFQEKFFTSEILRRM